MSWSEKIKRQFILLIATVETEYRYMLMLRSTHPSSTRDN